MLNEIEIIGWVSRDPEYKEHPDGTRTAILSVVTERMDRGKKNTAWFTVIANGKLVGIVSQMVKRGTLVRISGNLMPGEDGNPRVFIGTRGTEQSAYEVRAKQILVLTPKPPDDLMQEYADEWRE
jgi:single-stranded DNA-binding protein